MPITVYPASPRQVKFVNDLRRERGLDTLTADEVATLTGRDASREIDRLLALPRPRAQAPARPALDLSDVPPSKYMVDGDRGQRVHVEVVERRGGRRFVNVLIGAPGDWRRDQVWGARAASLADKVRTARYFDSVGRQALEGPEAAAVRFSREYKVCAACLSPLSDESQPGYAFGLGPVCRTRFGH